ncbi:MAG: AgmX/PglI C-terminal domain-containing protein [Polyangiaceae bacterium]
MRRIAVVALWVAGGMAGCASAAPELRSADDVGAQDVAPESSPRRGPAAPSVESEVGALDRDAVEAAFAEARGAVQACITEANQGLAFEVVGGDIEVEVRIKSDGSVRHVYPKSSTIGHAGAEKCILDAVAAQSWPKPEGGDEGIARTKYGLDPPAARPPTNGADLGTAGATLGSKLRGCRSKSGTSSLAVTLYIDADGEVMAAGASVGDEAGLSAIDCAVKAAEGLSFPSPGSYPAKVIVEG